jgi:putative DNA primase/helicase
VLENTVSNGNRSSKLPFEEVAAAALSRADSLLPAWFPAGRTQGHEYMVGDLAGNPGDSLRINTNTGKWSDFASGEKGGGDLISLRAARDHSTQGEALKAIQEELGLNFVAGEKNGNGAAKKRPPDHTIRYEIKNVAGEIIAVHLRREWDRGPDKKPDKDCLWESNGQSGLGGLKTSALPLFGSETISKLQPGSVIELVEGEKTALALRQRGYTALATVTGSSTVPDDAVLETIMHLTVRCWPDNDVPGWKHMRTIAGTLVAIGTKVLWVKWEDAPPKGDAADYAGSDDELRVLLGSAKPYAASAETTTDETRSPGLKGNGHFLFLGYDDDLLSFFSRRTKQVVHLPVKNLSNRDCLKRLAPLGFWESNFPGKSKVSSWDTEAASEYLQSGSYKTKRIFHPDTMRGRGAWEDERKIILHLGDRLLVDSAEIDLDEFQFRAQSDRAFCYSAAHRINVGLPCAPLTIEQGRKLVELCEQFLWTNPLNARLLLGWIVVAPICGTLKWRPHIWLTGPSGSGKGTVLTRFVKPLMPFRFPSDFSGQTTEAGIRQSLKLDALPVLFDEAESEDDAGRLRIRRLLGTIRASSSADEKVAKGTTSGRAMQFEARSSFLLSSINTMVDRAADRRRIAVTELRKSEDPEQWDKLDRELRYVTPEIGNALFARTVALYAVLRQNIEVFRDQISKHLGDTNAGDQYGPLMAGAYLLEHDEPVEAVDAFEIVKSYDWTDFGKPHAVERDEVRCLDTILGALVPVQVGQHTEKITIGELIKAAHGGNMDVDIIQREVNKTLPRYGIKVEGEEVWIANHSAELEKLLPRGPWQNWPQHLKRLKGAEASERTAHLAGTSQRYTRLPWDLFV